MKHLLLQSAYKYKKRSTIQSPTGFAYDKVRGAWLSADNRLLIHHEKFPSMASKKFDVETGEDHKGE